MRYRQMGRSRLTVSAVGLGCNNFGGRIGSDQSRRVIDAAVDAGVTLFDTADIYGNSGGSETILGEALKGRRHEVVLATKWGMDMGDGPDVARGSRWYIRRAVEASLRRLQTDYLDLYQLHQPDPLTPLAETLSAANELVVEGKVRYLGCSNFAGWQVADADWFARTAGTERFISVQNEYSLLNREPEAEVLPACERFGLGFLPFFPLARGLLSGKYRRGETPASGRLAGSTIPEETFSRVESLAELAGQLGHSLLDLAFAYLASKGPVSSVIAGATSPEQVSSNVAAGGWVLTSQEIEHVEKALPPGPQGGEG